MGAQGKLLLKMKHDEINPAEIGIQGGVFVGLTAIDIRALEDNVVRFVAAQAILDGISNTPGGLAIRDIMPDLDFEDQLGNGTLKREWVQPISGGWQGAQNGSTETQIYQTNKDVDNTQKVICFFGVKALNGGPDDAATAVNGICFVFKRSNSKTIDMWHTQLVDEMPDRTVYARTPVLFKKGDNARIDMIGKSTIVSGVTDNYVILGKVAEPLGKVING